MADEFATAVTRQAIAQLALHKEVKSAFTSVLDSLTDVVKGFIMETGVHAQGVAEQGHRQVVNIMDLMEGLKRSVVVANAAHEDGLIKLEDLEDWVLNERNNLEPMPFHLEIPAFPIPIPPGKAVIAPDSENSTGSTHPPPPYVPSFLPPFPAEHAYRTTQGASTVATTPAAVQKRRLEVKKETREAVANIAAADAHTKPALLLPEEENDDAMDVDGGLNDAGSTTTTTTTEGGDGKDPELFGSRKRAFAAISTAEGEQVGSEEPVVAGGDEASSSGGPTKKGATTKQEERLARVLAGTEIDDGVE